MTKARSFYFKAAYTPVSAPIRALPFFLLQSLKTFGA